MGRFRKKPVEIEAIQVLVEDDDLVTSFGCFPEWAINAFEKKIIFYDPNNGWSIKTLEGDHRVSNGDFIIKGVQGELYPCKPDIFKQTYEPVE